jgi:hypothetical protein
VNLDLITGALGSAIENTSKSMDTLRHAAAAILDPDLSLQVESLVARVSESEADATHVVSLYLGGNAGGLSEKGVIDALARVAAKARIATQQVAAAQRAYASADPLSRLAHQLAKEVG